MRFYGLVGGFFTGQLIQSGGLSFLVDRFAGNALEDKIGSKMTTGSYIVNVRKAPDSQAVVLTTLNQNTEVEFLGEENGWYKVKLQSGETGYVLASFLTFVADVPKLTDEEAQTEEVPLEIEPEEQEQAEQRLVITNEFANIRSKPSAESEKIAVLHEGDSALYLETDGDWYKLKLEDGTVGYVNAPLAEIR